MSLEIIFRFPITAISSVLGFGYLTTWHRHWSAFAAIILAMFIINFDPVLAGISLFDSLFTLPPPVVFIFSKDMTIMAAHLLWFTPVLGWFFLHVCDEPPEHFTLDTLLSQFLVLGLGTPAVAAIAMPIVPPVSFVLQNYLVCPEWLAALFIFIMLFSVPFMSLRLFDHLELWPVAFLRIRHPNSALVPVVSALSSTFYTLFVLYTIAFLIFELHVGSTVLFMELLFQQLELHFLWVAALLVAIFGENGWLYQYLRSLGLIEAVSSAVGSVSESSATDGVIQ